MNRGNRRQQQSQEPQNSFLVHWRVHGPRLLAETVLMLQTFLPPLVVLVGVKLFEVWGATPRALHFAETVDTLLLSLMIILIALNSFAQFLAITINGWLERWKKDKSSGVSSASS